MVLYRKIEPDELSRDLFIAFRRRQVVTNCWRKENGIWIVKPDPFIDDWSEDDYTVLVRCLRNTLLTDGLVYGAFVENELKGFVSVEGTPIGAHSQYLDLSSIHVSEDMRGHGIGRELFAAAIRDYQYGTLIGTTTYGKGMAQEVIPLGDDTALYLSTNLYYPPSGENYEGVGVAPHTEVSLTADQEDRFYELTYSEDDQLKAAVAALQ